MSTAKEIVKKAVNNAGNDSAADVLKNLPIVTEPRCNVCKSDFRPIIDRMIAGPYSYSAIARQFRGKDKFLSGNHEAVRKSIERHAKSHVTIRDQAIREIVEARAAEHGMLVDDLKNTYLTSEALLELYMQKGFEQVTKEDVWVRHQDILEAVKMLEEMRRDTVSEEIETMKKQVWAISQAIREIVSPDMHPAIVARAQELFMLEGTSLEKARKTMVVPTQQPPLKELEVIDA